MSSLQREVCVQIRVSEVSKRWQKLKKDDLVDIVAPGFRCTDQALAKAVAFVQNLGLRARVPQNLFGEDLICANDDKTRLKQLKKALYAKDSKAVWCVRAGYGAIRLMPEIRKWKAPTQPKLFIGYSDATTLHYHFNTKWGWPSLHGPLLDRLGEGKVSVTERHELEQVLFGSLESISFDNLVPLNKAAVKKKKIVGKVTGGNLTVLASSIGTPSALKSKSKILVLEDVGERAYRIDRMLNQLQQSKALDGVLAIVLGDFIGGADKDDVNRVWPLWKEFAERQKVPVLRGMETGHGELQRPVPLGTQAELRLGSQIQLEIPVGSK